VSSRKLRFDGWVLDPESGDLERAGTRIRLPEQPVQVLVELITHAGSVVPREQLIARLWPKGVVDFDTGLNTVMRKLRGALGDTSETPRYIETLPRRGYRFIGALDPDPEAASGASAAVPGSTPSRASLEPAPPSHQEPTALPEAGLAAHRPMPNGHGPAAPVEASSSAAMTIAPVQRQRLPALAVIAALAVAALLTGVYALWRARSGASVTSVRVEAPQSGLPTSVAPTSAVAFSPPLHSIAVMPFVNMSGDPSQEYFSDGLTEELLNSLSRIEGLQVSARTSSFAFKGKDTDIGTIAHKLNVASILEGSVRRSVRKIRVTAQLNNAITGFHLWSQTYDRDLDDVLKLQAEIADAVAAALEVNLLGDVTATIEVGGTHNPAAFDAYLRASKVYWDGEGVNGRSRRDTALALYTEAIRLDPNYALAYAARSIAQSSDDASRSDALKAIALAPDLGEAHLALALVHWESEFRLADEECQRALALAPGNARVLRDCGAWAIYMGRGDLGLRLTRRAVALDPLNLESQSHLADALFYLRRPAEALAAANNAELLRPGSHTGFIGFLYYELGDFESARSTCEKATDSEGLFCLAITYDKLGRHADAEAILARLRAAHGDRWTLYYCSIYTQWGKNAQALDMLEKAARLRSPGLWLLKVLPLVDPLRHERRFQAVLRELKFPD
jgi:TolB-like protein/DNA-binding winged helix-turn-helix (wHTH) protein